MKFDKDTLIKHRFWLLLAATAPMILVAVFLLITSVSASIEAKKKEVEAAKGGGAGEVVGPATIEVLRQAATEHKELEAVVHKQAYEIQGNLMTFPKAVENRFDFSNGLFATAIKIVAPWDKKNPESWPADGEHLFHGIVKTRGGRESITVQGKDGKDYVFYPTPILKIEKTAEKKEGEPDPDFPILGTEGNRHLAITYYKSKYFYDPLTRDEEFEFIRSYKTQLHPILTIVDPVDERGEGVVQLKGWLYNANAETPPPGAPFLRFVPGDWKADGPIYKEVWLAQEDLWIQSELYRIVREANDTVARCTGRGGEDKSATYTFKNPNYEFKIKFDGPDKLVIVAKNNQPRRQKLDVWLRIRFNKSDNESISTEKIIVADEPLDPPGGENDTRTVVRPLDPSGIERTGIYSVEQVLTWETAPVKRIDEIAIGKGLQGGMAHSHRTIAVGSKTYLPEDEKKGAAAADGGADPMDGGGMPAPVMMPMGGGFGGDQFGAQQANLGVNGVLFDRYIEVTPQSRRVPVGIALIVDQDHVDRVLTAFNNSKMRFLTTQVLINRYPNSVRPQLFGQKVGIEGEAGGAPPMLPVMPMGGFFPMGGGEAGEFPGGFGPMGGFGMPGAGMVGSSGEELENNVELVIYGIVTLYERYPKRKIEVTVKTAAPAE